MGTLPYRDASDMHRLSCAQVMASRPLRPRKSRKRLKRKKEKV